MEQRLTMEQDIQLLQDLTRMEVLLEKGWVRGHWHVWHGFGNNDYCLVGAMNKTVLGVPDPIFAQFSPFGLKRRRRVLSALGFSREGVAQSFNDGSSKNMVLFRIRCAKEEVQQRISREQLRLARKAQEEEAERQRQAEEKSRLRWIEQREREAIRSGRFVQEWLDKDREEEPLVVPEDWAIETPLSPDSVRG